MSEKERTPDEVAFDEWPKENFANGKGRSVAAGMVLAALNEVGRYRELTVDEIGLRDLAVRIVKAGAA